MITLPTITDFLVGFIPSDVYLAYYQSFGEAKSSLIRIYKESIDEEGQLLKARKVKLLNDFESALPLSRERIRDDLKEAFQYHFEANVQKLPDTWMVSVFSTALTLTSYFKGDNLIPDALVHQVSSEIKQYLYPLKKQ